MLSKFTKKVKLILAKHKILVILFIFFLIITPVIVIGTNTTDSGFHAIKRDLYQYTQTPAIFWNSGNDAQNINPVSIGICIQNYSSSNDYFIPTRTLAEWNAFFNNRPDDLFPVACNGDGACNPYGGEDCETAPFDCADVCSATTITYVAGPGGTLTGSTTQIIAAGNNGTTVTANANGGRKFIQWSDGNINASRSETNVTVSKTLTASFTQSHAYMAGPGGSIKVYSPNARNENNWGGVSFQYALDAGWETNPAGTCGNYSNSPWFSGRVYEPGGIGTTCSQWWTPSAASYSFYGWWGPCVEAVADYGYVFAGWEYGGSSLNGSCSAGVFSPFILSGAQTYGWTNWGASNPIRRDTLHVWGVEVANFVPSGQCGNGTCNTWETCAASSNDYGPVSCYSDCGYCG